MTIGQLFQLDARCCQQIIQATDNKIVIDIKWDDPHGGVLVETWEVYFVPSTRLFFLFYTAQFARNLKLLFFFKQVRKDGRLVHTTDVKVSVHAWGFLASLFPFTCAT
jgi:hypothetical protein